MNNDIDFDKSIELARELFANQTREELEEDLQFLTELKADKVFLKELKTDDEFLKELKDKLKLKMQGNFQCDTQGRIRSPVELAIDELGLNGAITCAWLHNEDVRTVILNKLLPGWNKETADNKVENNYDCN